MPITERRQQDRRSQSAAADQPGAPGRPRVLDADARMRYLRARAVVEDVAGRSHLPQADPRQLPRR